KRFSLALHTWPSWMIRIWPLSIRTQARIWPSASAIGIAKAEESKATLQRTTLARSTRMHTSVESRNVAARQTAQNLGTRIPSNEEGIDHRFVNRGHLWARPRARTTGLLSRAAAPLARSQRAESRCGAAAAVRWVAPARPP